MVEDAERVDLFGGKEETSAAGRLHPNGVAESWESRQEFGWTQCARSRSEQQVYVATNCEKFVVRTVRSGPPAPLLGRVRSLPDFTPRDI